MSILFEFILLIIKLAICIFWLVVILNGFWHGIKIEAGDVKIELYGISQYFTK